MTLRERPRLCERCGYLLDRAEAMDGRDVPPAPGDVSTCWRCFALYGMTPHGWRPLTTAQIRRLRPALLRSIGHMLALRMLKGPPAPDRAGHG